MGEPLVAAVALPSPDMGPAAIYSAAADPWALTVHKLCTYAIPSFSLLVFHSASAARLVLLSRMPLVVSGACTWNNKPPIPSAGGHWSAGGNWCARVPGYQ